MRGTVLSASVLSVALGIVLAAAGVVHVDATDQSIVELIELALILTLFSDGMFVERELLRRHWSPVARALVIAMPITMALLALAAKALFPDLSWAEAFLLGGGALADRPGRHLRGRHLAPRPERGPPHAQPRVRPQRRPGAALRPLLPRPRLARRRRRRRSGEAGRRGGGRGGDRRRPRRARRAPAPPPPRRRPDRRATRGSTRSASPSSPSASPT